MGLWENGQRIKWLSGNGNTLDQSQSILASSRGAGDLDMKYYKVNESNTSTQNRLGQESEDHNVYDTMN